jgi:hypothetical protein
LFKVLRNVPLVLTLLINFLLLGWLNLPLDFSQAQDGWKWPQNELLWERLVSFKLAVFAKVAHQIHLSFFCLGTKRYFRRWILFV